MSEEKKTEDEKASTVINNNPPNDFPELFIDVTQKFNDRTVSVFRWASGILVIIFSVVSIYHVFSFNSEESRIDRRFNEQDQKIKDKLGEIDDKFYKLSEELKGIYSATPNIEMLSYPEKEPLDGKLLQASIVEVDCNNCNPENKEYRLRLASFFLRNSGKIPTGRVWLQFYFELANTFGGEVSDEPGYSSQTFFDRFGDKNSDEAEFFKDGFPGAGFSTGATVNINIIGDMIPKGKHKILIKVYYGSPITKFIKSELYFELKSDWVRPKEDQKNKDVYPSSNSEDTKKLIIKH